MIVEFQKKFCVTAGKRASDNFKNFGNNYREHTSPQNGL